MKYDNKSFIVSGDNGFLYLYRDQLLNKIQVVYENLSPQLDQLQNNNFGIEFQKFNKIHFVDKKPIINGDYLVYI